MLLRWTRAALLGAVVFGSGVLAHASADGLLPGVTTLVLLYVGCVAGCAVFLGARASSSRLVLLSVAGQVAVHTLLAASAGHRGDASLVRSASVAHRVAIQPWNPRSGQTYDQWVHQFAGNQPTGLELPGWITHSIVDLSAHPVMALAHVVGAVAIGLWLARGEQALWMLVVLTSDQVLASVRRLIVCVRPMFPLGPLRLARIDFFIDPAPRRSVWSRVPALRGPPVLLPAR